MVTSAAHIHKNNRHWMHVQVCLNTLRAGLIASRIDLVTQLYPGVIAAPLIIGSIAGTGGRFSIDPILSSFGFLEGEYNNILPSVAHAALNSGLGRCTCTEVSRPHKSHVSRTLSLFSCMNIA